MEYEATGLFYEEFEVGRAWKTAARTIGESDVNAFSALTGDYTYLHTDAEAAARTPFGERVGHGLLGLSFLMGLVTRLGIVEGTDTTLWFGFKDDVAVRVRPHPQGALVDVRSISRVGIGDMGLNAERIGEILQRLKGGL